jgi:hypothetical protein
MAIPSYKIGDTVKVVTKLFEDDDTPINISGMTVRSVLKKNLQEIIGENTKPDNFTVVTIFQLTPDISVGDFETDVRFSRSGESFATPTVTVEVGKRVS